MNSVGMVENVTFTYCAEHYLVLLVVLSLKIDFILNKTILIMIGVCVLNTLLGLDIDVSGVFLQCDVHVFGSLFFIVNFYVK